VAERIGSKSNTSNVQPHLNNSEYFNIKTECEGARYDSKAQANFARDLDLLRARGKDRVESWERQVRFSLVVKGTTNLRLHRCRQNQLCRWSALGQPSGHKNTRRGAGSAYVKIVREWWLKFDPRVDPNPDGSARISRHGVDDNTDFY
jgi:hypothetical protein